MQEANADENIHSCKALPDQFSLSLMPRSGQENHEKNDAINASENAFDPILSYESNMQRTIGYLRSKNPTVKIIVSLLIPSLDKGYNVNVIKLNSIIPDLVTQLNTNVSRVVITRDLRDSWTPDDFADNVHPNTSGQLKIAKVYYDALVENKYLTKTPTFSQQSSPKQGKEMNDFTFGEPRRIRIQNMKFNLKKKLLVISPKKLLNLLASLSIGQRDLRGKDYE